VARRKPTPQGRQAARTVPACSSFPRRTTSINRPSGKYALLYGPRAGGGNAGAVAAALDQGPYALPFTDMDLVYKKLDLLNFGDPTPLRAALVQLDGEIYADVSSVAIGASQLYLGALREQMRRERPMTGPLQQWLTGFGSELDLSGDGDSHDLDSRIGGLAGGFEYRFSPGLVTGVAYGWAYSHFSTSGISGTGDLKTVAITPYARYAPGAWYVEGAIGGAWNDASVSRTIVFPGPRQWQSRGVGISIAGGDRLPLSTSARARG